MIKIKKLLLPVTAALFAGILSVFAANTTFFTSIGDIVFPFTAPLKNGTAGTIDNMTIGATTPRAVTATSVTSTGAITATGQTITAAQVNAALGAYAKDPASSTYYPSYQFANNQSELLFSSTSTSAYAYITLAPAPIDGWEACFFSSAAITALYVYPNVGQSIVNAASSMSANTKQCYKYSLANTTWTRSQ